MQTGTPNININNQIYWWEEIPINTNQAQLAPLLLASLITLPGPYLIGVCTHAYQWGHQHRIEGWVSSGPDGHHFCPWVPVGHIQGQAISSVCLSASLKTTQALDHSLLPSPLIWRLLKMECERLARVKGHNIPSENRKPETMPCDGDSLMGFSDIS